MNSLFMEPISRVDELSYYIIGRKLRRERYGYHYHSRGGDGYSDHVFWKGEEDILHDPEACSPRILWIYLNEDGPTKAYKMWDLPNGDQAEEEITVTSDKDVDDLILWVYTDA